MVVKNDEKIKNIDSYIFLEYIKSYGFNPDNYDSILELVQSAYGSMSRYLDNYKQFLLSTNVDYDALDHLGINGAHGYFSENGILVPKSIKNDNRFLFTPNKTIYAKHGYGTPETKDFDVIISNGMDVTLANTANFQHDKYLGFCIDKNDKNFNYQVIYFKKLIDELKIKSSNDYYVTHDTDSTKGKELFLIMDRKNVRK